MVILSVLFRLPRKQANNTVDFFIMMIYKKDNKLYLKMWIICNGSNPSGNFIP